MKVASSADWRRTIPFETAVLVAEIVPGEPTRCFSCGPTSEPHDRSELWAFKHRHPNHHDGFVRFYCREHVPVVAAPPVVAESRPQRKAAPRAAGTRTAPAVDRVAPRRAPVDAPPRAMCPNCFVEVSAKGECGMCGAQVV